MESNCESHGHAAKIAGRGQSPTYKSWLAMRRRCHNPKYAERRYYAGRGIRVCDRWRGSFSAFLSDMGERPDGTTLDRIDPNGDYSPENCRWATPAEQNRNYSRNRIVKYGERDWIMSDLAKHLGVSPQVLRSRIDANWPTNKWGIRVDRAFNRLANYSGKLRRKTPRVSVEYKGERLFLIDLADRLGINASTLRLRIKEGWPECDWAKPAYGRVRPDNSTGAAGVTWETHINKWRARVTVNGRTKELGVFASVEEAAAARKEAEAIYK